MALNNLQDFQQPNDIATAIAVKTKWKDEALIVAGGTFVHGLAARGLLDGIQVVLDISRIGLNAISTSSSGLDIGATATYGALATHLSVENDPRFGALIDALTYPPPQILNVATVGGCLAASCPLFDLPVAVAALGGMVVAQGSNGEKSYPLDTFFTGLFESCLADDEIVTAIRIAPGKKVVSGFAKLETNANDLAIINIAVSLEFKQGLLDRRHKCVGAHVWAGGGVGETISRLSQAEAILASGAELTADVIANATNAAASEVNAQSDQRASARYRRKMVAVQLELAIERALVRLK